MSVLGFGAGDRTGISSLFQAGLLGLLRIYKVAVSPFLPSACRFHPTCSDYARESIMRFGAARGAWLGLKRVGRCHPFSAGGVDPVPHD